MPPSCNGCEAKNHRMMTSPPKMLTMLRETVMSRFILFHNDDSEARASGCRLDCLTRLVVLPPIPDGFFCLPEFRC